MSCKSYYLGTLGGYSGEGDRLLPIDAQTMNEAVDQCSSEFVDIDRHDVAIVLECTNLYAFDIEALRRDRDAQKLRIQQEAVERFEREEFARLRKKFE